MYEVLSNALLLKMSSKDLKDLHHLGARNGEPGFYWFRVCIFNKIPKLFLYFLNLGKFSHIIRLNYGKKINNINYQILNNLLRDFLNICSKIMFEQTKYYMNFYLEI